MKFERTKHREMWDYLASHAEDIIADYAIRKDETSEDILIRYKLNFIREKGCLEPRVYVCYACTYCNGVCSSCPIVIGKCVSDDSYFAILLTAIENGDIVNVIDMCIKIRDAEIKEGVVCA